MSVTATATAETAKYFKGNQIVLWHYNNIPVPGVITKANNIKQIATIKVRNLSGQIQYIDDVAYSEIEARA